MTKMNKVGSWSLVLGKIEQMKRLVGERTEQMSHLILETTKQTGSYIIYE